MKSKTKRLRIEHEQQLRKQVEEDNRAEWWRIQYRGSYNRELVERVIRAKFP